MIRIICDKCNKEADFFGAKELTKEKINKLQGKLMIETYVCSSCGDVRDFIHVLH